MATAALLLVGYVFLAATANFDLTDGRFALYMDERITFDGVQRILYPESVATFLQSVLDGGDHRYGRTLWNSMAAASFLPAYVFGDQGQIIASRMLQVALLVAAFMVLAQTFVKSWGLKVVLLAALLAMPYTDYYMTMPKPEPLQLFFLSVFLFFYKKNGFLFGSYWIFLGLAFGTKISTLPAMAVFIAAAFLADRSRPATGEPRERLKQAAIFFLLGLGLAVPILLIPILALFLFQWGRNRLKHNKKTQLLATTIATYLFVIGLHPIKRWVSATFFNTKHGSDQESINFISWVEYFLDSWLVAPSWLGGVLIASTGLFLAYWLRRLYLQEVRQLPAGLAVALAGLVLNLAIFTSAHRLWGFYLYPGSVLFLTGLFSLIDTSIIRAKTEKHTFILIPESLAAGCLAALLTSMTIFYWAPHSVANFRELSARTERAEYRIELASYNQVVNSLSRLSRSQNKKLDVAFDPILFPPTSDPSYRLIEFWGPYVDWDMATDVLVFSSAHTFRGRHCLAGSPLYQACLTERDAYSKYVIDEKKTCTQERCYRRHAELPNGGEILVLERVGAPRTPAI